MTPAETSANGLTRRVARVTESTLLPWARLALLGLVVLIAFQLVVSFHAAKLWLAYRWLDELLLVILTSVALLARATRLVAPMRFELHFLSAVALFCVVCAASAWSNETGMTFFVLGTLDYLKALVFAWAAAVVVDRTTLERFVRIVIIMATICAVWMIIEAFIGTLWFRDDAPAWRLRFDLWRPNGLFGHPNLGGLFMLVAIAVEMTAGRRRKLLALLFYVAAILSMSRIVHAGLIVICVLLVMRTRYALIGAAAALVLSLAGVEVTQSEMAAQKPPQGKRAKRAKRPKSVIIGVHEPEPELVGSYRAFAIQEGMAIWRENPVLGIGPGRFGGNISLVLNSPIYREREWPERWMVFLHGFRSLDTFYPRLVAEVGAAGFAGFALIGLSLFASCFVVVWRQRRDRSWAGEWAGAGALLLCVVPVYLAGSGLNQAPFTVPLMIVVGAGMAGSRRKTGTNPA